MLCQWPQGVSVSLDGRALPVDRVSGWEGGKGRDTYIYVVALSVVILRISPRTD